MKIICKNCQAKLTIADQKIPKGKRASFLCPKCRHKIYIPGDTHQSNTNKDYSGNDFIKVVSHSKEAKGLLNYDTSDKPFDFIDENDRTALVCMNDNDSAQIVKKIFNGMGYRLISVDNAETTLTRLKYHIFDSVIVDEEFDGNKDGAFVLLNYISSLNMTVRRRTFVVFISNKYRTMDNLSAFYASVNLIINIGDISNLKKIFLYNLKEYEKFYSVFNDALKDAGKI